MSVRRNATSIQASTSRLAAPARFIMLHGVPGPGKSSLAEDLSTVLIDRGGAVDLNPEEAIFTRNEFREVGQGFKTRTTSRGYPTSAIMLAAYQRVIEAARRANRWVIADWNCVSMIEDLPWAQPDRTALTTFLPDERADLEVLTTHARDVQVLAAGFAPILLVLNVPIRVAVMRAARERGQEWIERYAAHTPALNPDESLFDRIVRGFEGNTLRDRDIINAYAPAGWDVAGIDANCCREDVLSQAVHHLLLSADDPKVANRI